MGVKATTSLDEILKDENVKGVFVAATPTSHFSIATQVLQSGKSLFIEKPPCQTLEQLDTLIDLQQIHCSPVVLVGLQKRYAPVVHLLKKRLDKEHLVNYDLHYLTGAYPEGNALLDLYIHPLDLVVYLFGMPEIIACRKVYDNSYIIMLQHPLGDVMNAFRLALVGIGKGPGMFDISAYLGKEETLKRLYRAVEVLK